MNIHQEFYCTKSGGGCGGYILVKLNMSINHIVEVVCPKCGHKHQRHIENGVIKENGRWEGKPVEEVCPTMAAYRTSEEGPHSKTMMNAPKETRDAVVFKEEDLIHAKPQQDQFISNEEAAASSIIKQSWFERFSGKLFG